MDVVLEIIGYVAGICTATCFLPQTIQTLKSREVKGLSALSYVIYSLGMLCWLIYGTYLSSIQMIIFNLISLLFALAVLYMIVRYKK